MFTRAFKQTDLHLGSHLSCHQPTKKYGTFYDHQADRYVLDLHKDSRSALEAIKEGKGITQEINSLLFSIGVLGRSCTLQCTPPMLRSN
ncbi:hypothetical protein TNCV_3273041 [Trichonephila clavipes]|nr:hypothetical protein TNCV_3273041 [Trichonephila clavipes]